MAGAGFKDFSPGDILTAADVDQYLMQQTVMRFASTAARASAVAAPTEGMMSWRDDDNVLEAYDGTQWVPTAAMTTRAAANTNLIYNGAMQIAQRGTSTASITSVATYVTADRWQTATSANGTWTQSIESDGPSGSGLSKSLKMLCTTADASPSAADYTLVSQSLEGQDLQRIAKGSAGAQQLTLSFWVKSNKTGTYTVQINDNDNTRTVAGSYSIASSATWEKKTITFPADTSGALDNDNASSFTFRFMLAAGSDYTGGASIGTSWTARSFFSNVNAVGQTNLAAATNNYWQVTGVQLEVGNAATPFEFEDYGTTLRKCQRYYEKTYGINVAPGASVYEGIANVHGSSNAGNTLQGGVSFMCAKRTGSYTLKGWTVGGVANQWSYARSGVPDVGTTVSFTQASEHGFSVYVNVGATWTNSIMYGHWTCDAEL